MPFRFISKFFKSKDPIIIEPYGGFANDKFIFSRARVLENEQVEQSEDDGIFKNIWNTYKRLESDEVNNECVTVEHGTYSKSLPSDEEGYVDIKLPLSNFTKSKQTNWIPLTYRLKHSKHQFVTSTDILKPGTGVQFGVISDMDDTVIHTGVSSILKWRLLVNSISKHAYQRKPLEGVQEFYQALHIGKELFNSNPFFYVSNSPWNFYEYLSVFLKHNQFPPGPLMLRDFGLKTKKKSKLLEDGDKYKTVVRILEAYPKMKFVLIGDSAEFDLDIYLLIARNFPNRIHSIFIRSVKNKKKVKRVKKIIEQQTDIDVRLIKNSKEGMKYARRLGLIK